MNHQYSTRFRWLIVGIATVAFFFHQAQIACAADQEAVNLLEKIDPARDTIQGTWKLEGTRLITSGNGRSHCVLTIPYSPPGEYRLTAVIERSDETKPFGFGLVVGSKACIVRFEKAVCGILYIDGQDSLHNETTFRGQSFREGQPYTIECAVRKAGADNMKVTVQVDGKKIIDWTGTPSRLSLMTPKGPHIVVGKGKDHFLWLQSYGSFAISKLALGPIETEKVAQVVSPQQVIGAWEEIGPQDRKRTRKFSGDGSLVLNLVWLDKKVVGTWGIDGDRVYFSHPSPGGSEPPAVDKWFQVTKAEPDHLTIMMMGKRSYVWDRVDDTARNEGQPSPAAVTHKAPIAQAVLPPPQPASAPTTVGTPEKQPAPVATTDQATEVAKPCRRKQLLKSGLRLRQRPRRPRQQ